MKTKCEIEWKPVSEPPDDETTVLLVVEGSDEPVWPGFRDAGYWYWADGSLVEFADGTENDCTVTHWAHKPEPPK